MRTITVLSAAAVCLAAAASAAPPEPPKDPQAAVEPRSRPGAGQAFLEKFAGDWTVAKAFFPRTGEPMRAEGECRQAMIHGGRFLQSDFVFKQGDRATTGLGLIGFEPETGAFTSVWTDSRQTGMSFRRSREPFDGSSIVLYSGSLTPAAAGKEERRSKTVTRLEDGGAKVVHRQYALTPDGGERLMMELVMTRKPAPAPAAQ